MIEEILRSFLNEGYKCVDLAERDLAHLRQDPSAAEPIDRLYRALHTVKGTSGMVGFPKIQRLAQGGETLLLQAREGQRVLRPSDLDLVVRLMSSLEEALGTVQTLGSDDSVETEPLAEELASVITERSAATPTSPPLPSQPAPAAASIPSGPLRVMVVDDSSVMRILLKKMLSGMGAEVTEAVDGLKALELLEAGTVPQVMLLDGFMPEMDGFTLLGHIRAREAWKGMKVVMVTGEEDSSHIQKAYASGADAHLVKPFSPPALKEKFQALGLMA